jgi:hypothetical protein
LGLRREIGPLGKTTSRTDTRRGIAAKGSESREQP